MAQADNVRSTMGAAFAGCMTAVGLSAILGFQTFLYFQIFPMDTLKYKILVTWVWLFDAAHTILICTAIWDYNINHFGDVDFLETIVPVLSATVAVTAITTLTVNIFYGWRIYKMSNRNWALTSLIALLCIARTGLAFVTTVEMVLTKTFENFGNNFNTVLITALSISAATDIVVSLARYYYLRNLQQGYPGTQEMVDAVVVFTINDGCLTCAVVIGAITCLIRMPNNFIWLGIYFTIAKLYSNSVLATLNLRNWYRHRQRPLGIPLVHRAGPQTLADSAGRTRSTGRPSTDKTRSSNDRSDAVSSGMQVFVDHQVEYNVAVAVRHDLDSDNDAGYDSKHGQRVDTPV